MVDSRSNEKISTYVASRWVRRFMDRIGIILNYRRANNMPLARDI